MKTRILKDYGISGIEVKLNVADQILLMHTVARINSYIENFEKTGEMNREIMNDLFTVNVFLKKLTLKDAAKPTIFDDEEEVPVETQEPKK